MPEWKDETGALFATSISCMGLIDREVSNQRFKECPCLHIPIKSPSIPELQKTVTTLVQYVSQNKLAEAIELLRQQGAYGEAEQANEDASTSSWNFWSRKKVGVEASLYDRDAELRARLQALKAYLRSLNRYVETFDVQLPELPVAANQPWFVFNGPVYMFLQNANATSGFFCRLVFPSMSKEGQPILSFDNLAKAHRWVERLINSILYTNGTNCNVQCANTPVSYSPLSFKLPKCWRYRYIMPCGWTNYSAGKGAKVENYSVYQLNMNHPKIKPLVDKARIRDIVYSILPSDWEMYAGARYMLISENRKYFMMLMRDRLGVFENRVNENLIALSKGEAKATKGLYKHGFKFEGVATKVIIEAGFLVVYGRSATSEDDNDILLRVQITNGGVQPIALYLHDDGRLSVFDGDNKDVTDKGALDSMDRNEEEMMLSEYDPKIDYQQRILRLLQWLRARNLIQTILMPGDDKVLNTLLIDYPDLAPDAAFDPHIDYEERMIKLVAHLRSQFPGVSVPSDTTLQMKLSISYNNDAPQAPFDPQANYEERTSKLAAYLQS